MARETKVGLLIGVGVILLIAIIVNDHLVTVGEPHGEPGQLTEFAPAAQSDLLDVTTPSGTSTAGAGSAPAPGQRVIPTADEIRTESQQLQHRELPPRSAQGFHAAARVDESSVASEEGHLILPDAGSDLEVGVEPEVGEYDTDILPPRPMPAAARQERVGLEETVVAERVTLLGQPDRVTPVEPSPAEVIHYVKANEALWDIAEQYLNDGSKWKLIAKANPDVVKANGAVNAGARLVIPGRTQLAVLTESPRPAGSTIDTAVGGADSGAGLPTLYTVKPNDSLYRIAERTLGDGGRYKEILASNRDQLTDADMLRPGMKLKLPDTTERLETGERDRVGAGEAAARGQAKTYTVKANDNLTRIARAELGDGSRYLDIYEANRDVLSSENDLKVGQVLKLPS